jgi:glycerophosphoryl diester phosphodiesterase
MITIALFAVVVLLLIRYISIWKGIDLSFLYSERPIYFGHRGERDKAPENTVSSYLSAIKQGLNAIELDVMMTKDNKLVCSHNIDLERETDGIGFIDETNYTDLKKIKTGIQFTVSKQESIPLLLDVIISIPKNVLINIEVKTKSVFDLKAAIKIATLIKNGKIQQRVIVSSFNPIAIRIVKLISKDIPAGFIYEHAKHFKGIFIARPDALHPKAEFVTDKLIKFCKRRNMRINTWTVNNVYARDWLISKNIDGIITDNPALSENI